MVALADWSVADSDPQHAAAGGGGGTAAVAAARRDSFRQLYMRLLTEGAADELDALRTAGDGALDGASLSLLARRLCAVANFVAAWKMRQRELCRPPRDARVLLAPFSLAAVACWCAARRRRASRS